MAVPVEKSLDINTVPEIAVPRTVLLVDDSRVQRRIVGAMLKKLGLTVIEAGTGEDALEICRARQIDFIISDWVMPGMSGLELCTAFRALERERYGYFIMLTSKSETDELVNGLESGADDFLVKPVGGAELRARLMAGERVLQMEQELNEKNKLVRDALDELQRIYDSIDRDLAQARTIQDSLVPERFCDFGRAQVSMLLKPCGHIGGDLVGVFSPGPNRVGFYSIDVSGHGVTSAMMTARLAGYLSGRYLDHNIALEQRFDRFYALRPPSEVARMLNERLLADEGVEEYFTMIYGIMDLRTGRAQMVQAGHPHPALQRADGSVQFLGGGGPPVGLLPGIEFQSFDVMLSPGERLFLYSDGFTESVDDDGEMLEEEGLADMLSRHKSSCGPELLDDLFWELSGDHMIRKLDDDVSALVLEYPGQC